MSGLISDEVLSIVRKRVILNTVNVTLPSNAVEAMINRIDHQDKILRAYRVLVACHDNYLCEVDKTTDVSERLRRLESARPIVAELEI